MTVTDYVFIGVFVVSVAVFFVQPARSRYSESAYNEAHRGAERRFVKESAASVVDELGEKIRGEETQSAKQVRTASRVLGAVGVEQADVEALRGDGDRPPIDSASAAEADDGALVEDSAAGSGLGGERGGIGMERESVVEQGLEVDESHKILGEADRRFSGESE
jgi:hypothetical protein